ncbi:SWIM zinc finger family protein [Leptolyngbya sp. AN10]|uniref:SWIM zinc finger family protein n=1 Tax=Leptolyngbya sp. AN10 TaxID=3423365 RepID=UPI003D310CB2
MELGLVRAKAEAAPNEYDMTILFPTWSDDLGRQVFDLIRQHPHFLCEIGSKQISEELVHFLQQQGFVLLPQLSTVQHFCSCSDRMRPCKHLVALYSDLIARIEQNGLLLFELRGLAKDVVYQLLTGLAPSHLDSHQDCEFNSRLQAVDTYYPNVCKISPSQWKGELTAESFWQLSSPLPTDKRVVARRVSGIAVKKQGDFPSFWVDSNSFIEAMEQLYEQVKSKNKSFLDE